MLHVDAELVVWCEDYPRSRSFAARIYDRKTERFYSGSGANAWEAIAWCMDEYVRCALLGREHSIATRGDARPGDDLIAPSSRPRRMTPVPPITRGPALAQDAGGDVGCFERVIPTSPAPRLHHELVLEPETKTRRARGGRR